MRRLFLAFTAAATLAVAGAGCNNTSGSVVTTATATPTPVATASPVPTATPVPVHAENYLPLTNSATYSGNGSAGFVSSGPSTLANPTSLGTTCSTSLGTFGEYKLNAGAALAVVPYTDIAFNGSTFNAVISKNAAGDVYVVGYMNGATEVCTQPYPVAKAQMSKGTGWTFVDAAGVSRTAVVVSDHVTATFTAPTGGGGSTPTTYTSIVAEVAYGSDQTIYWAGGYGPVQTVNTTNAPSPFGAGQAPATWTASGWTLDPTSKSAGRITR